MIAGNVHVNDHHRAGDLVFDLSAGDGLVTNGTGFTSAMGPEDVISGQRPQRAVKEALSDVGEAIRVHQSSSLEESYREAKPSREALLFCLSSEGVVRQGV
jgi:hypothetical protein